jgi:hypothetical protein
MSTFSKTQSINKFASVNGLSSIEILKNPKTGKLFGSTNTGITFRIAKDITSLSDDLVVSWFTPEDEGEASWMLHKAGQGAEKVSSMSFKPVAKSLDVEF